MAETRIDIVRRCVAEERPLQVGVEWVRELAAEIDALESPPRPEPVAWALCDDEGVFDAEQDEATAKEWVRGGADCGLVRWLRPLVFGDVPEVRFGNPHPSAAAGACDRCANLTNALGFFASVIKSGEAWSVECENMLRAAYATNPPVAAVVSEASALRFVEVCAFDGLLPSAVTVLRRLAIGGRIKDDEEREVLAWLASRLQWAMDQETAAPVPPVVTDELLERVAFAIHEAHEAVFSEDAAIDWETCGEHWHELCRRQARAALTAASEVPVMPEAITDADGAPVLVYMVLDQHNTPVAHSQDKDDADFAASQLANDEQQLRVVACHLQHAASEVRG